MPEGDTIAQSARTLAGVLVGRTVTGLRSTVAGVEARADALGVVGNQVAAVESRGKHLLIRFSGGAVLRTHMRMTGAWHLYRVGTRWQEPAHLARVVVEASDVLAVCFNAAEVLARLRAAGERPIADALLDQSIVAGIGNVYKSEVLFIDRVSPFEAVAS